MKSSAKKDQQYFSEFSQNQIESNQIHMKSLFFTRFLYLMFKKHDFLYGFLQVPDIWIQWLFGEWSPGEG